MVTKVSDLAKVINVIMLKFSKIFTRELTLNNADSPICVTKVFGSAP
jgi:hypothetical protein